MNERAFRPLNNIYKPLKGISKEIADLEKQLADKKTEKGELVRLKEKLLAFKRAWCELGEAMESPYVEVGDESCDCYPFDKSFDEIDVVEWIDKFVEKINNLGV